MSSLPLEVHEVLEQEYVTMHGALDPLPTGARYREEDVLDPECIRGPLADCGIKCDDGLLAALNKLVAGDGVQKLRQSAEISAAGADILDRYGEYTSGCSAERKEEINRRIVDEALPGGVKRLRDIRLQRLYAQLHAKTDDEARTALCISGGGIRSATFALGVMQGLASGTILKKFDFLSTVSGGGYIGSWLSSWARRHPEGIAGVEQDLICADTAVVQKTEEPRRKIDPEPQPLRHLREYSNYLSPKLGIGSTDTWTLASLYLRNLLLNLLVLIPVLAAVLAIPRLYSLLLRTDKFPLNTLITVTFVALAVGFGYLGLARPAVQQKRRAWLSTNGAFVTFCVLPFVVASTAISLYWGQIAARQVDVKPLAIGFFAVAVLWPCVLYYWRYLRASAIERRESLQRGKHPGWVKVRDEFVGAILGFGTAGVLFLLLAKKVFPTPIMEVPNSIGVQPFLLPLKSWAPVSELYVCFSIPLILAVFFIQASIFVGISGKVNEDYDREWWGRAGAWLIMAGVFLAAASAIAVFGPVLLYRAPLLIGSLGGVSGVAAALIGYSAKTPANDKQKEESSKTGAVMNAALGLVVPLFLVVLLAGISLGTTWIIQVIKDQEQHAPLAFLAQFQSNATVTQQVAGVETKLETAKTPYVSVENANGIYHLQTVHGTEWPEIWALVGVALGAVILSTFIGVNRFSMHGLYRNRLIRAYLGASRYRRDPDAFTGFDADDNLQMYEMRPDLIWPTQVADGNQLLATLKQDGPVQKIIREGLDDHTRDWVDNGGAPNGGVLTNALIQNINHAILTKDLGQGAVPCRNRDIVQETFAAALRPMPRRAPLHVVNTALNLVAGEKLAWQERKAESFTVSPLHSGSLYLGYRDSKEYGGTDGISLGTAVTISGAAASPNMGYHSSGAMAFLLTILNVRLGSWLGNPGPAGRNTYDSGNPRTNLEPLLWELTGKTNDSCPLVYLSDGGHFENLGLYEMILRRCRFIVVSDGGCDPKYTFEDLGNAIRKVRTDLGVPIDMDDKIEMFPRVTSGLFKDGRYMATATIRYSAVDGAGAPPGRLIYLKPGLYSENYFPRDVYNYAQQSPDFPHESTSDQFYTESQFESYRALGRHVVNEICGNYASKTANTYTNVADFFARVTAKPEPEETAPLHDILSVGYNKLSVAIGNLVKQTQEKGPQASA
jgi:hypothetical protein